MSMLMSGFGCERRRFLYGGRRPDPLSAHVTLHFSLVRQVLVVTASAITVAAMVFLFARSATGFPRERSNAKASSAVMLPPTFVGSNACGDCHHEELKGWLRSHHQLAMQPATDASVLGNFSDATIAKAGITSTFFRRGKKFMVRTDGPDGALHDYEIEF